MARNSFLLKGWAVTVIGGLLALGSAGMSCSLIVISLVVLVCFWLLDSYYLYQEKLFRKLYEHVRQLPEEKIDFDMNTNQLQKNFKWRDCSMSSTMKIFYGGLVLVHIIILII